MSTVKATYLQNASSATVNLTNDTAGNVSVAGTLAMGSSFLRNRIINGDMRIDQRNSGASVAPTDAYTLDRWEVREDTDGAVTCQQVADAPSGFNYSAKITITTADSSLSATQRLFTRQNIEGYNVADLAFGTASAATVTLSFWVKSSLTGTFGGALSNSSTRSYPFTYSISSANTWEKKTVTVAGDTTGTWATDSGVGLRVVFGLGAGTDYSGTAGSWAAAAYVTATGAVSVIGTLNATWQVTGVQLEVGSVATPFERRQYGQELMLCQRYTQVISGAGVGGNYQRIGIGPAQNATGADFQIPLKVTMRIPPSFTATAANTFAVFDGVAITALTSISQDGATSANVAMALVTVASGLTSTRTYELCFNNTASGSLTLSAEL
jgi:hypothetical protein